MGSDDLYRLLINIYPDGKESYDLWRSVDWDLRKIQKFIPQGRIRDNPIMMMNDPELREEVIINSAIPLVFSDKELEIIWDNLRLDVI